MQTRAITLLAAAFLVGCQTPPQQLSFNGEAMGTTYAVRVVTEQALSEQRRFELGQAIAHQIDNVNQKMSTYLEDSELSQFNQTESSEPVAVSPEMLEVLLASQRLGRETAGAFDITVGPLVNAWGFGPEERQEDLTDAEITALLSRVGWDKIQIDAAAKTIAKLEPAVYVDLSAIAKGYAVDRVSAAIADFGMDRHMVEIGGEVRARGRNLDDAPWRIAIEKPAADERAIQTVVPLENLSMATSGDYRNYVEIDGKRFSHEIDPRTGRPIEHRTASVTVVDASCTRADGLATALIVLGEEEGFAKAVELGAAALFLVRDGDGFLEKATPAFVQRFGDASR